VPAVLCAHALVLWHLSVLGPDPAPGLEAQWEGASMLAALMWLLRAGLMVGVFFASLRVVRRLAMEAGDARVALWTRRARWMVPLLVLVAGALKPPLATVALAWACGVYAWLLWRALRLADGVVQPRGRAGLRA
jgi:hypothetical protein